MTETEQNGWGNEIARTNVVGNPPYPPENSGHTMEIITASQSVGWLTEAPEDRPGWDSEDAAWRRPARRHFGARALHHSRAPLLFSYPSLMLPSLYSLTDILPSLFYFCYRHIPSPSCLPSRRYHASHSLLLFSIVLFFILTQSLSLSLFLSLSFPVVVSSLLPSTARVVAPRRLYTTADPATHATPLFGHSIRPLFPTPTPKWALPATAATTTTTTTAAATDSAIWSSPMSSSTSSSLCRRYRRYVHTLTTIADRSVFVHLCACNCQNLSEDLPLSPSSS